jgi:hypothetical protein
MAWARESRTGGVFQPENRDWLRADFAKASSSRTLDFAEAHLVVRRAQRTMRECRSLSKSARSQSRFSDSIRPAQFSAKNIFKLNSILLNCFPLSLLFLAKQSLTLSS